MDRIERLREDALAIWRAGVDAVRSERLVADAVRLRGDELQVGPQRFPAGAIRRLVVVGAGKAGAGMAAGVEQAVAGHPLLERLEGWVNVPADCVRPLQRIQLHAARPAGVNEPTQAGVDGAERILDTVMALGADDLCLVLISGGGSALLPAPVPPLTLADKQAVTRFLMHAGATIDQLNTVRKRLSRIKGGGLARASRAGATIGLIISDIVGDPLDLIASAPTVADTATNEDALAVLQAFDAAPPEVPQAVFEYLRKPVPAAAPSNAALGQVTNHVIGNNQTAVAAAGRMAQRLGYHLTLLGSDNTGEANEQGRMLAARCQALRDGHQPGGLKPVCLISGGEPIVRLARTDQPRKGGRNQQLVLAGLQQLWSAGCQGIVLLSGGTDGEDGPTDAAGAWVDESVWRAARTLHQEPEPYLAINDSYTYFERVGGLLKTGPTHTNVMDLRVALVDGGARDGTPE